MWYRLPSRDGTIKGGVLGCHSDIGAECVEITVSQEKAECGSAVNTCSKGELHGDPPDTATEHRWTCRLKVATTSCKLARSQVQDENLGSCGNRVNTCSGGDTIAAPQDTALETIWTCRNRGTYFMDNNGRLKHSGAIRCAKKSSGGVRAVASTYTGLGQNGLPFTATPPASGCPSPHWGTVEGRCLPSCGGAKNHYCKANNCSGLNTQRCNESSVVHLEAYDQPMCFEITY